MEIPYCNSQTGSYNKANAAYSFGGVEGAVALLNKNLDMNIEHYVTVNFNALIDAIDALGGIELELTEEEVFWTNGYCEETSRVSGHTYTDLAGSGLMTLDGVQNHIFLSYSIYKG
ncbi:MAG: LCP family protein [Dorea formicigenerans]